MYDDYLKLLLETYHEKKKHNSLSRYLSNPAPGRLKRECINALLDRYQRKDEKALRDFFNQTGDNIVWERVIKNFDTDKFRPLVNYLIGESNSTSDINIEILAWLIGIEDRPYDSQIDYANKKWSVKPVKQLKTQQPQNLSEPLEGDRNDNNVVEDEQIEKGAPIQNTSIDNRGEEKIHFGKDWKGTLVSWKAMVAVVLILTTGATAYLTSLKRLPSGSCMFWNKDHYEPISCHPRSGDTMVIALDSQKLKCFKKINQPDTITYTSLKQTWYVKYKNNMEYYTSHGWRPIEPKIRLKPLSVFMYEKYILPLRQTGKATY